MRTVRQRVRLLALAEPGLREALDAHAASLRAAVEEKDARVRGAQGR